MSPVCLRVRIGGEHYALGVQAVREVAALSGVTPVPGAGPAVLGVSSLRGQVYPVLDLGAVLGVPGTRDATALLVTEQRGRHAALAVDELEDVCELHIDSDEPESIYLEGAAFVDGALIGMVDIAAVLASASTLEGTS